MLSSNPADHEVARDQLAVLLTQKNGEYLFRIGQQPPRAELFAGDPIDTIPDWTGVGRSTEDLHTLQNHITQTVGEIGGRVSFMVSHLRYQNESFFALQASVLFEVTSGRPRTSILLRLPPPNVSLTPEVRCAVVGNVDSGKSTTLGVLTRGTSHSFHSVPVRFNLLSNLKVPWTMGVVERVWAFSDINMSSRQGGLQASVWRSVIPASDYLCFCAS